VPRYNLLSHPSQNPFISLHPSQFTSTESHHTSKSNRHPANLTPAHSTMSQGNKDNSPPTLGRESTNGGDQDGNNSLKLLKDPPSAAVLSLSPKDLKMAFDGEWKLAVGTFEEERIKWSAEKKALEDRIAQLEEGAEKSRHYIDDLKKRLHE
jgi:hypothetical protein